MPGLAYAINVNTPCPGEQLVNKRATNFYTGANGDFTYALLNRDFTTQVWSVVIYDTSGTTNCTPQKVFEQATPDPDNPEGAYYALNQNGQPDQSVGVLSVSPFP